MDHDLELGKGINPIDSSQRSQKEQLIAEIIAALPSLKREDLEGLSLIDLINFLLPPSSPHDSVETHQNKPQ